MQRWRQRSREGEASTCAALDVCACEYLGSTARSTNASGARAASMVTIEARRALSACARAIPRKERGEREAFGCFRANCESLPKSSAWKERKVVKKTKKSGQTSTREGRGLRAWFDRSPAVKNGAG